jgi:hypothetical protein
VLSALTVIFGREIVDETRNLVKTHPTILVLILFGVFLVGYLLYRLLRQPAKEIAEEIQHKEEAEAE